MGQINNGPFLSILTGLIAPFLPFYYLKYDTPSNIPPLHCLAMTVFLNCMAGIGKPSLTTSTSMLEMIKTATTMMVGVRGEEGVEEAEEWGQHLHLRFYYLLPKRAVQVGSSTLPSHQSYITLRLLHIQT